MVAHPHPFTLTGQESETPAQRTEERGDRVDKIKIFKREGCDQCKEPQGHPISPSTTHPPNAHFSVCVLSASTLDSRLSSDYEGLCIEVAARVVLHSLLCQSQAV